VIIFFLGTKRKIQKYFSSHFKIAKNFQEQNTKENRAIIKKKFKRWQNKKPNIFYESKTYLNLIIIWITTQCYNLGYKIHQLIIR